MMTSKDAVSFLKKKPSLSLRGLEQEAGIPSTYLSKAVAGKPQLLDKHLDKLEPVLRNYGYKPIEGARIIAIANNKGGVGKTTSTLNLGKALHLLGHKVLLVDMDPQGNLSEGMGFMRKTGETGYVKIERHYQELEAEIHEALHARHQQALQEGNEALAEELFDQMNPYEDVVVAESEAELAHCLMQEYDSKITDAIMEIDENFHIAPTHLNMDQALRSLESQQFQGFKRLREVLAPVRKAYDFILIDCPPSLGMLTSTSIIAANSVLVTMYAEPYSMSGLDNLLSVINESKDLNPDLMVEGIVFTRYESVLLHKSSIHEAAESIGHYRIFETVVRKNIHLAEAIRMETDVFTYNDKANGALDYMSLAKEIVGEKADAKVTVNSIVKEMNEVESAE